eukprot:c16101_g1_i1 orf=101-268(-)
MTTPQHKPQLTLAAEPNNQADEDARSDAAHSEAMTSSDRDDDPAAQATAYTALTH